MKTKISFLLDVSGSMEHNMDEVGLKNPYEAPNRLAVAKSAFKAIQEVLEECRNVYGVNVDYDTFVFGDKCVKVPNLSTWYGDVGDNTLILPALKTVLAEVNKDDPANKRIILVLTDGCIGGPVIEKAMLDVINTQAQDIKVIVVGIGDGMHNNEKLIHHRVIMPETAEAELIAGFEDAL